MPLVDYPQLNWSDLMVAGPTLDPAALSIAQEILDQVRKRGDAALQDYARQFDGWQPGDPLTVRGDRLMGSLEQIPDSSRLVLERTAKRIRSFAMAQKECLRDCQLEIAGGTAGHRWYPLASAGCYAPGGRYPLPSSVLMTAVTARVAGVNEVWVASPKPTPETLAAAAIAGATGVLMVGGAQAIAAMAFGMESLELPRCDTIVGPGNRFVTAAKAIIAQQVRIDSLAGPSELVVVASPDANPKWVAADLLAQAEHDSDARAILITESQEFAGKVLQQLESQLENLATAETARQALRNSGYLIVESLDQALAACEQLAPEHLSLQGQIYEKAAGRFRHAAALFVGPATPEVLGDYGAGPNHVLPTGGTARTQSGLSVASFMRMQSRLEINDPAAASELTSDATELARMEGLEAHARSAKYRRQSR